MLIKQVTTCKFKYMEVDCLSEKVERSQRDGTGSSLRISYTPNLVVPALSRICANSKLIYMERQVGMAA